MRIGDLNLTKRRTKTVTLWRDGEELLLTVTALPLNARERINEALPMPEPRMELARENSKLLRDANGYAVKVPATQDANYQRKCSEVIELRTALNAFEALRNDPQVLFETKPEVLGADYAKSIRAEFAEAGFSDGELAQIIEAAIAAEVYLPEAVDEAGEGFLPGTPPAQAGGCQKTQADPSTT